MADSEITHHAGGGVGIHEPASGSETDWWLWLMYGFFIFAVIVLFFIIIFEDPEVRAYSRQSAQRFSDWYHQNDAVRREEMAMLSARDPNAQPSPPLYQTIVPPNYQYQKPPTPRDPPPKYEDSGGAGVDPSSRSSSAAPEPTTPALPTPEPDIVPCPVEEEAPARAVAEGQPEYLRHGRVRTKASSLMRKIRENQQLINMTHFIRGTSEEKPITTEEQAPKDTVCQSTAVEEPESLVFELETNPFPLSSH